MEEKRVRYIKRILTLDRINQSISITRWDTDNFEDILEAYDKNYGLKLISEKEEILITIEYSNIIWNYKIYYGSYKKKYKPLVIDDDRWTTFAKGIEEDLKMMGLVDLKEEVLNNLNYKKYYEYQNKSPKQFKKYCI